MTTVLACPSCGSNEVIPRVRMVDRGDGNGRYDLQVEVYRRPNARLFKGAQYSSVFAQLCGVCGHIELYADTPRAIHAAYLQAEPSSPGSASEELALTREALADSQLQLEELREKLVFLEQLIGRKEPPKSLPKGE